jgi:hypothetical protein
MERSGRFGQHSTAAQHNFASAFIARETALLLGLFFSLVVGSFLAIAAAPDLAASGFFIAFAHFYNSCELSLPGIRPRHGPQTAAYSREIRMQTSMSGRQIHLLGLPLLTGLTSRGI